VRWLLLAFTLKAARKGFLFAKPFSFVMGSKKKRFAFNEYKNSRSGPEIPMAIGTGPERLGTEC